MQKAEDLKYDRMRLDAMINRYQPNEMDMFYKFQLILVDMQLGIYNAMKNNADKKLIDDKMEFYERVHEMYRLYDMLYFSAKYNQDENTRLKLQINDLLLKNQELKSEKEKLEKTINWH